MKRPALFLLVLLLAACASSEVSQPSAASQPPGAAQPDVEARVAQAAVTPLTDLNLVRTDIPPALVAAQKAPYALPSDLSCAALAAEVQALDAALGADLDTPPTPSNPGLIERGSGAVGDAAVGAVRSTAEGVVPFRGWIRKLSGAERYSKEVAAAIAAGAVRRAYLKGLGQAAACPAPAAPRK
jgi:hypothetical protein